MVHGIKFFFRKLSDRGLDQNGAWSGRIKTAGMSAAAVLSGLLLAAAFPPLEKASLAWLAFVPLLTVLPHAGPRRAALLGAVAGGFYWLPTLAWLLRLAAFVPALLVVSGWLALSVYCAAYTAVFAWLYSVAGRRLPFGVTGRNLVLLTGGTVVWAGLEYVRCRILTGFPWNPLGVSQYRNLPLIQIAEFTGVHGVSALVMLFNISLSLTLLRYLDPLQRRRGFHLELAAAALLLAVCWSFGIERERQFRPVTADLNLVVVQTGIPQVAKWEPGLAERLLDRIGDAIAAAVVHADILGGRAPDMIILPETVLPFYADHPESRRFMSAQLQTTGTPILAGVMAREPWMDGERYFNRSVLYIPFDDSPPYYDKQHLVPFGEYIPFSGRINWLERLAPLGWNCTPGEETVVFELPGADAPFAVTICFEDAFPYLARRFARAGARLLINQTNDAWFDPSSASRQHLAQGVFRSVETRLPTVRAANTGVSALIDRNGRIRAALQPTDSIAPGAETAFWRVSPAPADARPTMFTRFGDFIFAFPAAMIALGAIVAVRIYGAGRPDDRSDCAVAGKGR